MSGQLRTKGGAVLLQRLGALRAGEQSRWGRAPGPRGMWAFPWPMFDLFFAYHQYADVAPVRLRTDRGEPVHPSAYVDADGQPAPRGADVAALREDPRYEVRSGFFEERDEWVRTVGRRTVARHQFWYSGDLYAHLTERGEILALDEWRRMPAALFAEAVRRSGGRSTYVREGGGVRRARTTVDHLEVFLPAGAGRVEGRPRQPRR